MIQSTSSSSAGAVRDSGYTGHCGVLGRIQREVSKAALNVLERLKLFFVRLGQMRMDVSTFGRMLGLCVYGFSAAKLIRGSPVKYDISPNLNDTKNMIDAGQALDGISYFGSEKSEKTITKSLGNAAMMTACIGVGVEILDSCKLLSLEKIGKSIGSIPFFGAITKAGVAFGQLLSGLVVFGWVCFAVDAVERIVEAENGDDRRQAFLDLVWNIAEIAATVFVMIAGNCTGGVIIFGATAALLGISSYWHSLSVKEHQPKTIAGVVLTNY